MKVKCKRCEIEWNYKGKKTWYVTCPNCYTKVNIQKLKGGQNLGNGKNKRNNRRNNSLTV